MDAAAREELHREIFENNLAVQLLLDPENGRILEANSAACRFYGSSREELSARTFAELTLEAADDVQRALTQAASGHGKYFVFRQRVGSGGVRDVEIHCGAVHVGNRPVLSSIIHDITDRVRAEEALRESEEKYRLILETMEEAYYEVDLDGNLLLFNDALGAILGSSREEIRGTNFRKYQHPASAVQIVKRFRQVLASGRPDKHIEWSVVRKDGEQRHVAASASLILDRHGKPVGFRGVGRDVTEAKTALQALSESEQRFRDLFDNAPVGYHEIDAQGRYVRVNQTELNMLGYSRGEVIGHEAWEFVLEDISRKSFTAKLAGVIAPAPFERTFLRKDGTRLPVLLEDRVIYDAAGRARGIRTTVIDITGRKRAEEALRESEERYRQLVELSPDAIAVHCDGRFVFVNSAAARLFGANEPEDLIGRRAIEFVHPDSREVVRERGRKIQEEHLAVPLLEQKLVRLDGSPVDVEVAAMPFAYNDRTAVQVVIRDITERKLAEEQIRNLAYHDSLTGLPNRILFHDRLAMAVAQAHRQKHRVGVLFIDLDRFKVINDSLGHTFGDKLLQGVSERIHGCIREGDTLARLGGDEFTVLLPGLQDTVDAAKVAEKVLDALRVPFRLEGRELYVTASMGVSIYPDDGPDVEALIKNSDVAMYRAKEQGRDNYQLYTAGMNARALERLSLENSLRKALAQEELLVYYQPLVNLETGTIHCVEALVRWRHPELGLVSPKDFIPIAELTGLIVPIGPWVLRTACAQLKAWQSRGHENLCVSVNLSARQFQHPHLAQQVKSALEETGLDPRWLELEITESNAMENAELTTAILRDIKALGVRISIDDFGIGYSSLSYLKRLPINTLKIDQSFVRDITTDPDDAAIARAVIAMAHSLKLKVVAEGVETAEQLSFLAAHGCDRMQGFYFSEPLPADHCEAVLSRRPPVLSTGAALETPAPSTRS